MFTDSSAPAIEDVLNPLEMFGAPEVAAKANVDASALLSENFLSIIHMIAQGNAWLVSGLRPSTGIMFSNMPDSSATERQWGRKTTVSVTAGLSGGNRYYSGDMDNVHEWLQNNLFVAATKNPLMSVVGIDVKGIKVAPAKKGAKAKVDRGTAAIHLNMLHVVGGIAFGWLFHDVLVDKSGNVVAGKDRRRYGWTDEDEKLVRETRVRSRKEIEEQAKMALSRIFPDMNKFPFKAGDKAEYEIPLSVMMKETSSPDGEIVDKGAGKPLDILAAFKKIEDQVKVTFKVTVTNVTTEDDDEYSRFHMDVVSTIHVPLNLLYHITDTDPADGDVKRALVYLWLGEALKRQFAAMKPKKKARGRKSSSDDDDADAIWPIKISDPVQMKKRLEFETKLRGNAAKPRTDSRGWSVTESGEFFLFPDKNLHGQALISYTDEVAQILSALEIEKNRDARDSLLEKLYTARKRLGGKIVVADWAHDTMVYVNTAGNFELNSLRGYQAVTASDEMFILNLHMKHPRIYSDINIATQAVMNALNRARSEAYEEIDKRLPNASHETYSLEEKRVRERIPSLSKDDTQRLGAAIEEYEKLYASRVTIAQMAGHDLDKLHVKDGEITKNLIANLDAFRAACKAAIEIGLDKVLEDKPDTTRFGMPRWLIETIGNTSADRFVALNQLDQQEKAKTVIGSLPDDLVVPNLGQVSTLPHQTDIVSVSAKAPRTHLMAVGTGGGKTLLAIIDAILLVHRAGAKRVLYMTDGVLTPQLISEINNFSDGKINAVPLSPDIIRRLKSDGFVKNSEDVVKWIKSFPPNTIFVAETISMSSTDAAKKKRGQAGAEEPKQRFVKLFDDEPDSIHYMMAGKVLRQFAEVCLRCEFDAVIIDEAQRIRGLQGSTPTNVGGAARRFLSRANFRREMTGTPAHNNPEDPVKLALTVMPVMFGTLQEAVDYYSLRDVKSTDTADGLKRLGDQLTSGPMAYTTKTREDWSFALPSMKTSFVSRKLTPRQSTFYDKMMADIMMRFEAGDVQPIGDMAEGEAEAVTSEAEQDDATNGGDNGNGEEGEDEIIVGGKKIKEAKLRLMFEPVRQFLAAPDRLVIRDGVRGQRNAYMMSIEDGETPSGMDLMSPHVETVGSLIIEHLKKPNGGKILVFGQNLCTSEHLERWLPKRFPELSDKLIRYTAKNKGALDRFKSSETHKVLLADMESMKAGHNLQMVDLIIRVQTPWTPGDVEQSTARMYRPDFSGLRLASNVQQIWSLLETNSGGATIDHMMAARVFQKQLAVSELRYRDRSTPASRQLNDAWERFASDRLPRGEQPFKMSPDMIRSFRKEDAEPFFAARDALDEFENQQSRQRRLQMAVAIERSSGKSIIDHATGILKGPEAIKIFLQNVMFKLPEGHTMPGSKRVYAPWIPRMQVADPQKLGLHLPLTEDEALSRLKEGLPVMTEYGPGVVGKINKNKVKVKTGIGELTIDPMLIALPAESGAAELAKMAKNMKAHVLTPPGKLPSKMIRPDVEDAEIVEEVPEEAKPKRGRKVVGKTPETPIAPPEDEVEPEEGVKIDAGVIDGMPAFIIADPEVTFVDDIPSTKWHKVGDFVNLSFTTPQALGEFVEAILDEDNPVLRTDKARAAVLRGQALIYLKRKSLRASKAPAALAVTKLWNEILKNPKPKAKGDLPNHFPHLMSIGLEVRMVYMLRTLLPAVQAEVLRLARESGGKVRVESKKNPGFRMALFPTVALMSKAVTTLKTHAAHAEVVLNDAALAESVKLAKNLYSKMEDPSKLVEKTEKKISEERQEAEAKKAKKKPKAKDAEEAPKEKTAKAKKADATKTAKTKKATKEAKTEKKAKTTKKAAKKSSKKAAPITAPKKAAKAVTKTPKKAAKKKEAAPAARKRPSRSAGEARA